MNFVELQWLQDYSSLKSALQETLSCSGQLLKKHFSSKQLQKPVKAKELSKLPLDFVNHLKINPQLKGPLPEILKVTEEYLVLHKPGGVHCHPLSYNDQDTLLNFLAEKGYWKELNVNQQNYDRGLMYRLDYETSGIMIVARNQSFFESLRSQFKEKMKRKLYWVVVEGDFNKEGQWTHYFRATGVKGAKQKVDDVERSDADVGELLVKKVAFEKGKSLLLVNLNSGLRHQIRAQLSFLGFPILGDELYGGKKAERLFLHAWRYEWEKSEEDIKAELFDCFFDLNSALQVCHDMLGIIKSR